jgi:hypothetical protein
MLADESTRAGYMDWERAMPLGHTPWEETLGKVQYRRPIAFPAGRLYIRE